jgi:hypothetical protein
MNSDAMLSGNVISLADVRRAGHAAAMQPPAPAVAYDRRQAIERLRRMLPPGSIVYTVRRWFHPDNDWLVCDFFRIDAHDVTCITRDVAMALERFDPEREVGVKLIRLGGIDPLVALIDGALSRLLHGEPAVVQHAVIA